jgi:hypothetical protein
VWEEGASYAGSGINFISSNSFSREDCCQFAIDTGVEFFQVEPYMDGVRCEMKSKLDTGARSYEHGLSAAATVHIFNEEELKAVENEELPKTEVRTEVTGAEGFSSEPLLCTNSAFTSDPSAGQFLGQFTFEEGVNILTQCGKYCSHKKGCKALSIRDRECTMHGKQPVASECQPPNATENEAPAYVYNRIEQTAGFCETGDSCISGICLGWNCCEEADPKYYRRCAVCALADGKCTLCAEKYELDNGRCKPLLLRSYNNLIAADVEGVNMQSVECGDNVDAVRFPLTLKGFTHNLAPSQASSQDGDPSPVFLPQDGAPSPGFSRELEIGMRLATSEVSGVATKEVNVVLSGTEEDVVSLEVCIVVSDAAAANMLSSKVAQPAFLPKLQTALDDLELADLSHANSDPLSIVGGAIEILYSAESGLQPLALASTTSYTSDKKANTMQWQANLRGMTAIAGVSMIAAGCLAVLRIARQNGYGGLAGWHAPMQVAGVTEVAFELGDAPPSAADGDMYM